MTTEVENVSSVTINLEDDVAAMLHRIHEPIEGAVREVIALELYRRGLHTDTNTRHTHRLVGYFQKHNMGSVYIFFPKLCLNLDCLF